jgi:hypothetical protein
MTTHDLKKKKGLSISGMYEGGICISVQRNEVPPEYMDEFKRVTEDLKLLVLKVKK